MSDTSHEAHSPIRLSDLAHNPFHQFEKWFTVASQAGIAEPNAMSLATCAAGEVTSRMVLMKYWDENGFVFFTNYGSCKAEQIQENPRVALLFYWETLHRQVRIQGVTQRIPAAESLRYFATRPRGSQLGAWCSQQSQHLESRRALQQKLAEVKHKFANREVPLPKMWGGYRVTPSRFEFWQQGEYRLHDRFVYLGNADKGWQLKRLSP